MMSLSALRRKLGTGAMAVAVAMLCGAGATPARAQVALSGDQAALLEPENLTDREIQWAIDALEDGLFRLQNDSGTWERLYANPGQSHVNSHVTGQTSIATLALLGSGISYQDPRLAPAIDFLKMQHPDHTYVRSLRSHIWALLPAKFEKLLEDDSDWLLHTYDFVSGSWNYTSIPMESGYDNSLTQYGLLGLWEAAKRDVEVPQGFWKRVEDHYLRTQLFDGGWNYRPASPEPRGSMTAAGLTCLFITQDYLNASDYLKPGLSGTRQQVAIDKGLRWLDINFVADHHPGMGGGEMASTALFYYLYGIERVGLASGYKRFGEHDWFRDGAAEIIRRLCNPIVDPDTGEITGLRARDQVARTGMFEPPVVQFSFALMFLSHGRAPIAVNKIRDPTVAWNNRPRDAARMASWLSNETESRLSWQILDVDRPIEEWFDAPMVYLAGHQAGRYVTEHRAQLARRSEAIRNGNPIQDQMTTLESIRRYLDLGGLLVTNADSASKDFTAAVRELGKEMYPHYEWRTLDSDHPVYRLSSPVVKEPALVAMSNGVRELIIHCPSADLGAALQVNDINRQRDAFNTVANIYFYASERGLTRPRLGKKLLLTDEQVRHGVKPTGQASPRRVTVLRGRYSGNWDPEPAADELLALRLRDTLHLDATFQARPLSDVGADGLARQAPLLIVRGTGQARFSDAEMKAVQAYVAAGGVVLFENTGGVSEFGAESEKAVIDAFGGGHFRRPIRHAVVTGAGLPGEMDCAEVAYRMYSLERFGGREIRPRIRAFRAPSGDGQPAIFVSREDIANALLGQPCWGVNGYRTESAAALMGNLIEYAILHADLDR